MRRARCALVVVAIATIGGLAMPSAGAATQVVHNLTVNSWFGFNEGPSGSVGNTTLVPGPATPPAGTGSAKLTVDSNGRASLATNAYAGTKLSQISALQLCVLPADRGRQRVPGAAVRRRLRPHRREHRVPGPAEQHPASGPSGQHVEHRQTR